MSDEPVKSTFPAQWRMSAQNVTAQLVDNEEGARREYDLTDADAQHLVARARMCAEQFIEQCGYDLQDSDQLGDEMGKSVLDALTFAFMRLDVDAVNEFIVN